MNEELKPCPVCGNAVQVGSCDAFVVHPVSTCELSGKTFLRTIWQESALVNALRAQLVDARAEIKRLEKENSQLFDKAYPDKVYNPHKCQIIIGGKEQL
jgi:hypothetical protein